MQGGPAARTACLSAWYLPGTPFTGAGRRVQVFCKPGASCDADGSATDGVCTFRVAICLNNTDPTQQCQASSLASFKLLRPNPSSARLSRYDATNADSILAAVASLPVGPRIGPDSVVGFDPALTATNLCTGLFDVMVPLKAHANGTLSKGTLKLRSQVRTLAAPTNRKGTKDSDTLTLLCYPP